MKNLVIGTRISNKSHFENRTWDIKFRLYVFFVEKAACSMWLKDTTQFLIMLSSLENRHWLSFTTIYLRIIGCSGRCHSLNVDNSSYWTTIDGNSAFASKCKAFVIGYQAKKKRYSCNWSNKAKVRLISEFGTNLTGYRRSYNSSVFLYREWICSSAF